MAQFHVDLLASRRFISDVKYFVVSANDEFSDSRCGCWFPDHRRDKREETIFLKTALFLIHEDNGQANVAR
jgi:hypothetical protein